MDDLEVKRLHVHVKTREPIGSGVGVQCFVNLLEPGTWLFERLAVEDRTSEWFSRAGGPREESSIHRAPEKIPFLFYNKSGESHYLEFTAVFKLLVVH